MTKRAVIIAAEGVQDVELLYPVCRLQEAGYAVAVAAPTMHPFNGIKGVPFAPDMDLHALFAEPWPARVDLLVLPGGVKAMEKLRMRQDLLSFIQRYHERGGVIGCICSGAQLLISAKIVRGRKISAYYAMRDDVENAGAEFVDAPAVTCERIVTSPHYKHLGPWMRAVLEEVEKYQIPAEY